MPNDLAGLLTSLVRDLRLALRRLCAAPAYTLFSVATLALAIGITTAVYSVVYHFLRIDYGVEDHRSVYNIRGNGRGTALSVPDFADIEAQQQSFLQLAAWGSFYTNLAAEGQALFARGEIVSGDYFALVRRTALHGRTLTPADNSPTAPPAVVLAAATARRLFSDDAMAVGRVVTAAGQPFTVAGVMRDDFRGLSAAGGPGQINFWVPLAAAPQLGTALSSPRRDATARDHRLLQVFGRLRPDVTMARASDELRLIGQSLNAAYPPPPITPELVPRSWSAGPAFPDRVGPDQSVGRILIGLPALVFLIACTNLANLSLSRGIARRNTLAIRHALGATRWRLVREETTEAVIIALVGGSLGLVASGWLLDSIIGHVQTRTSLSVTLFVTQVSVTPAIAASALMVTLLAMVIGGLLPALSLTRRSLRESMASGNDTSLPRWRGRSNLIALQVGVSVGLFLIAFAASRALPNRFTHPGPRLDGLAAATIPFAQQGYDEPRTRLLLERVTGELRRTPGITSVGVVAGLDGRDIMLLSSYRRTSVTTADRPFSASYGGHGVSTITGSPDVFGLLGITPISGRTFSEDDAARSEPVVVINDALARELFGATDVSGRHVQVRTGHGGTEAAEWSMRVVGVVPSRGVTSRGEPLPEVYLPLSQHYEPNVIVLARGSRDLPVEPLRRTLRSADPLLATAFIGDGARLGAIERVMIGTATTIGHGLAAFALLLALAGLYGVLSHVVSLRSRELAVRVALGATARRVATMVLRDGLRPVVEGLLIALGTAMVIRKVLSVTVAEGLSTIDPVAFVVAATLLLLGGLVACLLPARRASRIDPNVVLKES
jgi:putative ABC transport system permease protein